MPHKKNKWVTSTKKKNKKKKTKNNGRVVAFFGSKLWLLTGRLDYKFFCLHYFSEI